MQQVKNVKRILRNKREENSVLGLPMVRVLKIVVFFLLLSMLVCVYAAGQDNLLTPEELAYIRAKKRISIGIIDNEPPYSFYSHGKINGFSIDLLHILEQESGLKFEFMPGSWFDVYASFKKGNLDVIDQISFTDERSQWMLFTPAYRVKKNVLFMRTGDIPSPFLGIKSLEGKRVGIIKDIYYEDALRQRSRVEVVEYDDYISLMKALSFGWIDAVVSSDLIGRFIARDNNLSGLGLAGPLNMAGIEEEDYRLGVLKEAGMLHSILVKILNAVPAQRLEKLTQKWSQYPYIDNASDLLFNHEEADFIANHPVVTMGMLSDFSPFSFVSQGRQVGYTASLLDIISERTGLKFSYVVDDWPNVFYQFKTGQLDAVANISYTRERTKFTRYTDVYHMIPTVVFVRNDFRDYKDAGSLKNRIVGMTKDVFYKKELKAVVGSSLREFYDHSAMMKALSFGELDAVVAPLNTGTHYIRKLGLVNLTVAGEFICEGGKAEDLHFGIRPDLAPLDDILNKALRSLSASDWQMLETAWLSPETSSSVDKMLRFSEKETAYLKQKRKLVLCMASDRLPFGKMDRDGHYIGIDADFLDFLTKKLPVPITISEKINWAGLFQSVKEGQCDFCMGAMKTPKSQQDLDITDPYLVIPNVIATSVNAPFIDDFRKFLAHPMGVVTGSAISETLRSTYPDVPLVTVETVLDGIYKVQRGELFGFIGTMTSIGYHLRQEKIVDIKIAGKMPYDWQPGIGTRKDEPMLGEIFQKLIMSVSEQEKSRLLDQWLSVKVEQKFDYSPFWKVLGGVVILILLSLFWIHKVRKLNRKLIEANRALKELSRTDGLTGLFNRRIFDEEFNRVFNICKRGSILFAVVILDIDHFKQINDTYGHPAGDECLKRFSAALTKHFQRISDIVCRFGGEEFGIICTGREARKVNAYVNNLRKYIERLPVDYDSKRISFTISAGVYADIPAKDAKPETYLNMADQALYEAKNSGRNRVVDFSGMS